ncbi:NAD(P)H-dependent oxidoreductase NDAI_0H03960 [Naumovozyma dairenensis CBS 421]|uniref:Flavodoxin-like fold domain-containing protein n=1 Tax=Naumovozyma dairenensis (strain ATCC 10597 / BCRC 20456 / CBS 421 / NBRC 0211 / NRRL Y-12639) TaxID=1071378 RepID=G0WFK8_NAUDC|nr:hypothetical protein NDAI_0H03960 [Naumovozyma dairenensis CBS 421]CCD26569.1 hypothetical protein NDAI_0H03960 [Naumovozyma dairenensis CBS 421]
MTTSNTIKKVLIVFGHPERKSFNGSLLDATVKNLESQGLEVKVSDLYRMNWKSEVTEDDFPETHEKGTRLEVAPESLAAFQDHKLTPDVVAEQEKLEWADLVILQFPLWWTCFPAILKGWVDRVFSAGLAYYRPERFGDGAFAGKKAMLMVSTGGAESHYSATGIHGPINDLLFPIQHGMLFYTGMTILPPFVTYSAYNITDNKFNSILEDLYNHFKDIDSLKPIAYRKQAEDYDPKTKELKQEIVDASNEKGFSLHIRKD